MPAIFSLWVSLLVSPGEAGVVSVPVSPTAWVVSPVVLAVSVGVLFVPVVFVVVAASEWASPLDFFSTDVSAPASPPVSVAAVVVAVVVVFWVVGPSVWLSLFD